VVKVTHGLPLVLLGALMLVAGTAGAPTPSQASRPLRTVYIAGSVSTLPRTALVRVRDCVRRPRTCVNGRAGLELVY
jgi:hypothetical protein